MLTWLLIVLFVLVLPLALVLGLGLWVQRKAVTDPEGLARTLGIEPPFRPRYNPKDFANPLPANPPPDDPLPWVRPPHAG